MKPTSRPNGGAASANITKRIQELADWRGETLAHVRQLIHDADPDIQEEWKWEKPKSPGIPVWSHDGIVCTGESYKQVVKLTFARGASIKDPKKLFNSSLEGNTRRAIDLREGEKINEAAFKQLIRAGGGGQLRSARSTGSEEEVSPARGAALGGMTYERPFATEGELWDVGWRIPPTSSARRRPASWPPREQTDHDRNEKLQPGLHQGM